MRGGWGKFELEFLWRLRGERGERGKGIGVGGCDACMLLFYILRLRCVVL